VANSAIFSKGLAEKRGKCVTAAFGHRILHTKRTDTRYLYPRLFSSLSHWQPAGVLLSVDPVYDPATLDQGTTDAGS